MTPFLARLLRRPLIRIARGATSYPLVKRYFPFEGIVSNLGGGIAQNCFVQLVSIEAIGGTSGIVSQPLPWVYAPELFSRDIPPGGSDLFVMAEPSGYKEMWELGTVILPQGLYDVAVTVVGDNFRMRPWHYLVTLNSLGLSVRKAWKSYAKLERFPNS